ncbi:sulfurtransferase [Paenibacillus sediminis]|uniref:Thiosulfate/3-mercaptopyruvate sulfurtransferase n=1 Tax=Paenibacillus sediminis TaxID=664909 RepID=A0ABS4H485_9BACL|nr:sulfurtransferase [Paenibacillus sediminis]MBP1937344.1 thiosulfate/3-mercaptopyruvate sulfurtransferase [Paenibacillus sediminis]
MQYIVSKNWLLARLYEPDQVIVDCRFELGHKGAGRSAFEEAHIPGAVYLDLEQDLSDPVTEHGGRHPLPDVTRLAKRLGQLGIDLTTRVVAYDDQGGAMASRLWWLLRYMGHTNVFVMDEGFTAWKDGRYPVSQEQPITIPKTFVPNLQPDMLAHVDDVRKAIKENSALLIDSRDPRRFAGIEETMDKAAGHIPGAVNKFWRNLLDDKLHWKSSELIKKQFEDIPADQQVIVYCGSGVTACPNVIALQEAGYDKVKLYAGSWSDWISYKDNPIATGVE